MPEETDLYTFFNKSIIIQKHIRSIQVKVMQVQNYKRLIGMDSLALTVTLNVC